MLIPVQYPSETTSIRIQAFDNDFFSFDDFISGNDLELGKLMKEVYTIDLPIHFNKLYFDSVIEKLPNKEKLLKDIKFEDKEDDMEKSGKNEYVLTQNDVEDYSPNEIQKTFRNFGDETQPNSFQQLR